MAEEHIRSEVRGETTYCGDHYCGGHVSWTVNCSCGWSFTSSYTQSRERAWQQHVDDVRDSKLGLRFGVAR
jgi:hypothetical protein